MSKIIEKLTPEQEGKLDYYRDKWLKIGLSTAPCNFEESKKYAIMAYEAAGLEPPTEFELVDSPIACARRLSELWKEAGDSVDDPTECLNAQAFGCHDASWLGFYEFFLVECGIEEVSMLDGLTGLAHHCGWWAPLAGICIFQHRPCEIHMDDQNRLHKDDGPAILYRDGFAVYAIHGFRVNEQIVMNPETLKIEDIQAESDAEIRRIMIERFGTSIYLKKIGAKAIDVDYEGAKHGSAPRALIEDDQGEKWLYGTDGSTKRGYYMAVPNTVTTCVEAHNAIAAFDEKRIKSKS